MVISSRPAAASCQEIEALLAKHAVQPNDGASLATVLRTDIWQTGNGDWMGHYAFLRSRSPNLWCTATLQGARSSADMARMLTAIARLHTGEV